MLRALMADFAEFKTQAGIGGGTEGRKANPRGQKRKRVRRPP